MKKVLFVIALAAFCGGSIPPFAKVALEVFGPFTLVMVRFFFATLVLIPFVYKDFNFRTLKNLFWVSVIGALNPILVFIALQFTQASVSPLIFAAMPMMTALYLSLVSKQKISFSQVLGIIVGFIGVSMIILLPFFEKQIPISEFTGNILIFGAAIALVAYSLISKDKQSKLNISPLALTFSFSLITFILSIPFASFELLNTGIPVSRVGWPHILSAVEVGVVGTSIFYLAYQYALKLSSALTANLFTYLQPVATIILAVLLLGEKITVPFIIGGILAVIGAQIASGKTSFKLLRGFLK